MGLWYCNTELRGLSSMVKQYFNKCCTTIAPITFVTRFFISAVNWLARSDQYSDWLPGETYDYSVGDPPWYLWLRLDYAAGHYLIEAEWRIHASVN